jgi:hypothetical protein
MQRKRYFILDETCPGEEIQSMMGRVVLDYRLPLKEYAPREPLDGSEPRHNPQDIIPNILPKPSLTTNRRDFLRSLAEVDVQATLTEYFGFNLFRTKEETIEVESRAVRKYSLNQVAQYFTKLMENPLYDRDVRQLLSRQGKAYMVVGFLTTEGTTWKRSVGVGRSLGGKLKAPISMAVGMPPELDPSLSASHKRESSQEQSFETPQVEIFAIAYDVVGVSHSFDRSAPRYMRRDPVLGPAKRVKGHHQALGVDSDEEIEEADDDEVEIGQVKGRPTVKLEEGLIMEEPSPQLLDGVFDLEDSAASAGDGPGTQPGNV